MQSWQDYYDTPMPEEERQSLLEALGKKTSVKPKHITTNTTSHQIIHKPNEQLAFIPGYRVYDKTGNYLFSLGDYKHPNTKDVTALDAYKKGVQWFAPTADNYMPIDSISPDIQKNPGIINANADSIYKFAKGMHPLAFHSGGRGDWKIQENGGRNHILSEITGFPYWSDALGQIPYAINTYNFFNRHPLNLFNKNPKKWTDYMGKLVGIYGKGKKVSEMSDFSNSYDNYFIDKTTGWYENMMKPYEESRHPNDLDSTQYYLNKLYENSQNENK